MDIARRLDIEVSVLSQGADQALIEELRSAAESAAVPEAVRKAEELAGRLPDWARVVTEQSRRVSDLETALETLSDRLAHDPFLSASLHDVLTTAAAIRATSAILAEEEDVDPAWQARFHRNLYEDSRRLADSSRALASYLDAAGDTSRIVLSPQEELHRWLEEQAFLLDWIEQGAPESEDERRITEAATLGSVAAQALARGHAAQYRMDAAAMPKERFLGILHDSGPDPAILARSFSADYPAVFRRIAALADAAGFPSIGLAVCDGSGTLIFRKSAEGFPLPLFGAACPLWPLYQALARPNVPSREVLELVGRVPRRFGSYTVAESWAPEGFEGPQITRSYMLVLPTSATPQGQRVAPVGTSCRICPRTGCPARRESSVIGLVE